MREELVMAIVRYLCLVIGRYIDSLSEERHGRASRDDTTEACDGAPNSSANRARTPARSRIDAFVRVASLLTVITAMNFPQQTVQISLLVDLHDRFSLDVSTFGDAQIAIDATRLRLVARPYGTNVSASRTRAPAILADVCRRQRFGELISEVFDSARNARTSGIPGHVRYLAHRPFTQKADLHVGQTRAQIVWSRGFPNELGTRSDIFARPVWNYGVGLSFHSIIFANGRVVSFTKRSTL